MTSERWWIGKYLVGSVCRIFISFEGLRKTTKISVRIASLRGRESKAGPRQYEVVVLTTRPWRSVSPQLLQPEQLVGQSAPLNYWLSSKYATFHIGPLWHDKSHYVFPSREFKVYIYILRCRSVLLLNIWLFNVAQCRLARLSLLIAINCRSRLTVWNMTSHIFSLISTKSLRVSCAIYELSYARYNSS
jgi:hypothetical protein